MRLAIVADLHGNALALEAILKELPKRGVDGIVSLGDQVNLGCESARVVSMLREVGATLLRGNHERYVLRAKAGDPAYGGANFRVVRSIAREMAEEDLNLPMTLEIGGVTFCHALPEDDRFPVYDPPRAYAALREMRFPERTTLVCGHGHNPVNYAVGGLRLYTVGSSGCMDDGTPGTARYTIATLEHGDLILEPFDVAYHTEDLPRRFIETGAVEICPIMSRIACCQQMENREYLLSFIDLALKLSRSRGEEQITDRTWEDADRSYPWPDGRTSNEFWDDAR